MRSCLLLLLLHAPGCTPSYVGDAEVIPFDVSLSLAQGIPAVVKVRWDVELDGMVSARVAFGPDAELGREVSADVDGDGPHEAILVGSKGEQEVHLRVFAETADGSFVSEESTITTGPVPAALPNLMVTDAGAGHWGGFLVSGYVSDPTLFILDEDGDYVWWHESQGGTGGSDSGVVLGRTQLAHDGRAMLYSDNNVGGTEQNALHRVSLDGAEDTSVELPWAHHDFAELPDGTIAYLAYDPREVSGGQQLGDRIMELAPDGGTREVWNVWDWYEYAEHDDPGPGFSWPHGNAIDYVEEQDAYLVGFLTLGAIMLVDRQSGEPIWTLGGPKSDFTVPGGVSLDSHHQFDLRGNDLLFFDNGWQGMGASSGAFELALEPGEGTAPLLWYYMPTANLNCPNLGDVTRIDGGNTLVTFSMSGQIHEVAPDGEVVWQLSAEAGGVMSYVQLVDAIDAWP